jgi:hypothetical protein
LALFLLTEIKEGLTRTFVIGVIKMKLITILKKACVVASIGFAANATAGTTTWEWDWQLTGSNGSTSISTTGTNNLDSTTLNVDLAAWSDTGGSSDTTLETGQFYYYSGGGWGVVNQDNESGSPEHAFDNKASVTNTTYSCDDKYKYNAHTGKCERRGRTDRDPVVTLGEIQTDYDMALVSFDTSVELTGIDFGWVYNDADFTVLAYTGAGAPPSLGGSDWASVAADTNWLTVGNYDANSAGYYSIADDRHTSSQYWLIGAYNSIFGSTAYDSAHLSESDTDAFKIKSLTAKTSITTPPTDVPAPSAFGLLLVGALGIYARRNKKAA